MLYFAFGSNLDARQMRARCPASEYVGLATLPDHGIGFTGWHGRYCGGVATVRPDHRRETPGALYWLAPSDLARLDAAEGHPWTYVRTRMDVYSVRGKQASPWIYVHRDEYVMRPGPEYLAIIRRAYKRHGFDARPLLAAAREPSTYPEWTEPCSLVAMKKGNRKKRLPWKP